MRAEESYHTIKLNSGCTLQFGTPAIGSHNIICICRQFLAVMNRALSINVLIICYVIYFIKLNHCCPRKKERGRREAAPFFIAFVITTSKKP
jgi:hypothetical protein